MRLEHTITIDNAVRDGDYISYPEEEEIAQMSEVTDEDIDAMDQAFFNAFEQIGEDSREAKKAFRLGKRMRYRAMYLDKVKERKATLQ